MNIRDALIELTNIQASLSITVPVTETVKKAWPYVPPHDVVIPDAPCFLNNWTLNEEKRATCVRTQKYTVNMQLLVSDADTDRAADIATSFMVALVDALDDNLTLNGKVSAQNLKGREPTLVVINRSNQRYIGLNLFLELFMTEGKQFGP